MFSVDVEMNIVNQGFEVSVMVVLMFLMDFFLNQFEFAGADLTVANHVTKDFHSSVDITLKHLKTERTDFSSSFS